MAACVCHNHNVLSCNMTLVATVVLGRSIGVFSAFIICCWDIFFSDLISCDVTPTTAVIYLTQPFFDSDSDSLVHDRRGA